MNFEARDFGPKIGGMVRNIDLAGGLTGVF
jgi:hypothetical protein